MTKQDKCEQHNSRGREFANMKLRLIVFIVTNGFTLLASKLAGAAESAPATNDTSSDQSNTQQTLSFNIVALANTIQDSTNSSQLPASYQLIQDIGQLTTDPNGLIYHQSGHSNHRDNPSEPYPSASYTSSVTAAASPSASSNQTYLSSTIPHNHQSPLADSYARAHFTAAPSNEDRHFVNSYGNQFPSSSSSSSSYQHNHNYGQHTTGSSSGNQMLLNAGLIQNLTAALFPVRNISTATLQTLGDLLNKTRHSNGNNFHHQQQQQQHFTQLQSYQQQQASNSKFRPLSNSYNHAYTNFYTPTLGGQQMSQSAQINSFDGDSLPQFNNLLGQLGQVSKFGFREPSATTAMSKQQHIAAALGPSQSTAAAEYSASKPALAMNKMKIPSNVYKTYSSSGNILPLLTNGQSLNQLAASLLSAGYMDQQQQQQQPVQFDLLPESMRLPAGQSMKQTTSSNNYNYIQHHQGAQNHLDKVVYHSTPFRPSIVSPPPSMDSSSTALGNSSMISQQQQHHNNKSMAFGTLSSPSMSSISDTKASEYVSPISSSQYNNNSDRYLTGPTASGSQTSEKQVNIPASYNDDIAPHHQQQTGNLTIASSTLVDTTNASAAAAPATSASNKPPSLMGGQSSALLDIYEREIDQQIRDALLGESGKILSTMASRLVQSPSSSPMHAASATTFGGAGFSGWSYDEPGVDQSLLASWIQASPLIGGSPLVGSQTQQVEHFARPAGGPLVYDSLTEALQELPTFSAADLQPIFPSFPASSLGGAGGAPMMSASQESSLEQLPSGTGGAPFSSWPFSMSATNSPKTPDQDTDHLSLQTLQQLFSNQQQQQQQVSVANGKKHRLRGDQHQTDQQQHQASSSAAQNSPNGFPSLFYKLSPFAPSFLLSNPFNHLYSSLPNKNRQNSKTRPPPAGGQRAASTAQRPPQFAGGAAAALAPSNKMPATQLGESRSRHIYTSHPNRYQQLLHLQQQQQLATLLANLMATAATTTTTNPLPSLSIAAESGPAMANSQRHTTLVDSNIFEGQQAAEQTLSPASQQVHNPTATTDSAHPIGLSLAGGGISPLLWRTLFPSITIQRQPTTAKTFTNGHTTSSTNSGGAQSSPLPFPFAHPTTTSNSFVAQNQPGSQRTVPPQTIRPSSVSSLSPLIGGGSRLITNRPSANQARGGLKPKLKIRILKIPIAVYDQPSSMGSQQQTREAAASLLANLPCPLQHSAASDGQQVAPHAIDRHIVSSSNLSALLATADTMSPSESIGQPATTTMAADSLLSDPSSILQDTAMTNHSLQEKLMQILH